MKICWDNLEGLRYNNKTGKWYKGKGNTTYIYKETCLACGEPFLSQPHVKGLYCCNKCHNSHNNPFKKCSDLHKKRLSDIMKKRYEDPNIHPPSWKGGYSKKNIPTYDTYALQLEWCEEVRRNKEDPNILEIQCVYCKKWFIPTLQQVIDRIRCINGRNDNNWEGHFYCSQECKLMCPIFRKIKYKEGHKPNNSRLVQPQLRKMVLERDEYQCVKCGVTENLKCHHILPVATHPLESADIDNCITLCKECHDKIHKEVDGCGYGELRTCISDEFKFE